MEKGYFIFVHKYVQITETYGEEISTNKVLFVQDSNMGTFVQWSMDLERFLKKYSKEDIVEKYSLCIEDYTMESDGVILR